MINGIINIRKEKGYTSHDVVAKMRGILKQKKIGHTGTLDPDATGVLPVCLGHATKLCNLLTDRTKEYKTILQLGIETDTQDNSGTILAEKEVEVTQEQVREVVKTFLGTTKQIPPMYSAIKINGQKLYDLARQGKVVEREAREITITKLTLEKIDFPFVELTVDCSKGTYIRTLCHDIGQQLGCGATMTELVRTRVGEFTLETAITLQEVERLVSCHQIEERVKSVTSFYENLPFITPKKEFEKMLANGNPLYQNQVQQEILLEDKEQVRVYNGTGNFCAIYSWNLKKHCYMPFQMFQT
ncbi:MAG: tRNA pseudouridine(55) synthase TruB [Eubacteriales bacterium]